MAGLTDGGSYTCHAKQDLLRENDVHFHVEVNCELNKCRYRISVDNTPITKLMSTQFSSTANSIELSNPKRTGDGHTSFSTSFISSNRFPTHSPTLLTEPTFNVLNETIKQITTTTIRSVRTTIAADTETNRMFKQFSNRRQIPTQPYQQDKNKRWG